MKVRFLNCVVMSYKNKIAFQIYVVFVLAVDDYIGHTINSNEIK